MNNSPSIKIFLVDDHHIVLDGLKSMFDQDGQFEILGTASNAEDALLLMDKNRPDILLTDYSLPGANGLELCVKSKAKFPTMKRVILSMHDEGEFL
jgi:YesN/AraC family two-component response regulator